MKIKKPPYEYVAVLREPKSALPIIELVTPHVGYGHAWEFYRLVSVGARKVALGWRPKGEKRK